MVYHGLPVDLPLKSFRAARDQKFWDLVTAKYQTVHYWETRCLCHCEGSMFSKMLNKNISTYNTYHVLNIIKLNKSWFYIILWFSQKFSGPHLLPLEFLRRDAVLSSRLRGDRNHRTRPSWRPQLSGRDHMDRCHRCHRCHGGSHGGKHCLELTFRAERIL